MTDLVSVIITTYQNEKLLPRAINSLLHQTYNNIEIIVVDDNPPESDSRKQTELVMKDYPRIIYIKHEKNLNGAAARNTGISAARGKYIAFLDNDDVFFSTHIADCVRALQEHAECSAVFSGVVKICEGYCWDIIPPIRENEVKTILFSERSLGTGSNLFVKADELRQVGGFDTSFIRHQDIEFGLRFFRENKSTAIEQVQIIKDMGGFSNAPSFRRFVQTKKHLWDTFSELISALSDEEQNRYFGTQYAALLYSACKEGNMNDVNWTRDHILKYRQLSVKEKILIILTKLHVFGAYECMKKMIKVLKSKQIKRSIELQLSDVDVKELNRALCEGK